MAQSFTASQNGALADASNKRRKVLVTGAAGRIGSYFAEHSHERYDLRLMVRPGDKVERVRAFGDVVTAELSALARLTELCRGIDTIVHLAADPDASATWASLLENNIEGTYHLFAAAKSAGVRRVIYASSIHAVSGYAADVQVKTSEPVNPGDLYGVSKCFGEALARYMAEQEGVSAICLRIGAFQPPERAADPRGLAMLDAWVSHRDLNQLIQKCIDVESLTFAILHALSDNRFKRLDISDARELIGYEPQDNLMEINASLKNLKLDETVQAHNVTDRGQQSGIRDEV